MFHILCLTLIIYFHLQNPNKIAVESLELSVNNDGVIRSVRAIVSKHCLLSFKKNTNTVLLNLTLTSNNIFIQEFDGMLTRSRLELNIKLL